MTKSTVTVAVRSDQGDLGEHLKYGRLIAGATLEIDPADFAYQLFEPLAEKTGKPKGR
jgi:hypothetical protein